MPIRFSPLITELVRLMNKYFTKTITVAFDLSVEERNEELGIEKGRVFYLKEKRRKIGVKTIEGVIIIFKVRVLLRIHHRVGYIGQTLLLHL